MQDKTNGKLLEILADKNSPYWQDAFNEMLARVNDSGYLEYKGFERPKNPPPNP